ncbi:hypothetical protein Pmani_009038 [Petrolisthes manimaculis]|uniref:Major facilitator superfamily (MFS) profile domain-containing protein n=1 Tax=Petrolisthes manimaculis TaxID=1843537 RepID=A0AAE1UDZ7_9EUCA|nr:hypothetical protein Pmani_009038 [Petrolisthes manimaculis]
MSGKLTNFDDLLNQLGTGKWNILYFITTSVWFGFIPPQVLSGAYLTPPLNATCIPPTNTNVTHVAKDSCSYQYVTSEGTVMKEPCTQWDFDTSVYSSSITSDFGLVCGKEYLRATYTSLFMMGNFISPPIGGYLADRFGRWVVVVVTLAVFTAGGIIVSFLHNLPLILFIRFVMGTANLATLYILAMEVCETRLRAVVGIVTALPWALGTMAWGGIAYLCSDWRTLQLVVSLPNLLLFPALWLMDESPRWLIVKGQHDKALKVLHKAARWNKVTLPPETQLRTLMNDIRQEATRVEARDKTKTETNEGTKKCCSRLSFTPDLCRSGVRRSIIIMAIDFLVASMVFYGLNLNGSNLSTDPYLYMVLGGAMEIPAYTLTAPILNRFGRKIPTVIGYIISGVSILALAFIPMDLTWAVMTLAMIGKMCISAVYQTLYVYLTELMPTEVRIQGMGLVKVTSRIGSMTSPFITDFMGQMSSWLPSLVFGGVSMVAGVATLWARETRKTPLPDTISSLQQRRDNNNSNDRLAEEGSQGQEAEELKNACKA